MPVRGSVTVRRADLPHAGLSQGARAFVLLAVTAGILWSRNGDALSGLLSLTIIWVSASWVMKTRMPTLVTTVVESSLVAMVAGLYLTSAPLLSVCLAVPPFIHGLVRGFRGVAESLAAQISVLTLLVIVGPQDPTAPDTLGLFSWLVAGLGLGLVASFFVTPTLPDNGTAAYLEARSLINELNELSAKLEGGLDPTSMGGAVLEEVGAELPLEHAALHVHREAILLPLVAHSSSGENHADSGWEDDLAQSAWDTGEVLVTGHNFAFGIKSSGTPIAVVSGRLAPGFDVTPAVLTPRLERLAERLAPSALRLDTAQLFSSFRDAAMSDERRRLAREMHDGMAQDIASMGYVVDALVSTAATPQQEQALTQLRSMITRVVAEVRRSVMTLRTQAGSSESLGAAIATLARHLSDVSGTPIKVTTDERTDRLRHEVEAELLRIVQEAMNNAVKHSKATLIAVHCRVQAPYAEITVTDDGIGLQAGRRDSHGLSIMRERAALIGGVLEVRSSPTRGTQVNVRVGNPSTPVPSPHPAANPARKSDPR